jgi:hypothetical protein
MRTASDHARLWRIVKIAIWLFLALMVVALFRKPLLG